MAEEQGNVIGWASLSRYSHRRADRNIADVSVYVARKAGGRGVGRTLLRRLDAFAREGGFHKLVLFAIAKNVAGERLSAASGHRNVGIFQKHGLLREEWSDSAIKEKLLKPLVLFVCRHNTGRSQMAEAFLRHIGGDRIDVMSAGTISADEPNPGAVAAMAELGIDISTARPKLLDPVVVAKANHIITMGCDVEGVPRIDADWGLPDPKGQPLDRVREIRDLVRVKAETLAQELLDPVE